MGKFTLSVWLPAIAWKFIRSNNTMVKETKKYRVVKYVRVDVEVQDDKLFDDINDATVEQQQQFLAEPQNMYTVEEVNDIQRN